jgi:hypothetical protein
MYVYKYIDRQFGIFWFQESTEDPGTYISLVNNRVLVY